MRRRGYRGCFYALGIIPLSRSLYAADEQQVAELQAWWNPILRWSVVTLRWRNGY